MKRQIKYAWRSFWIWTITVDHWFLAKGHPGVCMAITRLRYLALSIG